MLRSADFGVFFLFVHRCMQLMQLLMLGFSDHMILLCPALRGKDIRSDAGFYAPQSLHYENANLQGQRSSIQVEVE